MTRFLILILTAASLNVAHAVDPVYVLDFSQEASLKTLFDAGLRPTQLTASSVESHCEVRDKNLVFIGPGGLRAQLAAEQVVFEVAADDSLQKVTAKGRSRNADAVMKEAMPLFTTFGGAPPNMAQAFRIAQQTASFEGLRTVGRVTPPEIEPAMAVGFRPGDLDVNAPFDFDARVVVTFYWKANNVGRKLRREPIKPPAGYENVDMSPQLSVGEIRRRKAQAALAAGRITPSPWPDLPPLPRLPDASNVVSSPGAAPALLPTPTSPKGPSLWIWIVGGISVGGAGWLLWKYRRQF